MVMAFQWWESTDGAGGTATPSRGAAVKAVDLAERLSGPF